MNEQTLDAFMCVHRRDIGYLFEAALESYQLNFAPRARLMLITNDRPYLASYIERRGLSGGIEVTSDEQWLSKAELELPGWFRQQVIKLRAHEFCQTEQFCNIGADTILLQPIGAGDLVAYGAPVLYYRSHRVPTIHWWFELQRVLNDARILGVRPLRALRYVDFINDLFCFDRQVLIDLNRELARRYGGEPYRRLLSGLQSTPRDQKKFGEWTLYCIYVLDCLRQRVTVRDSARGFLHQVHSARGLRLYRFNTKAVHFVGKDLDVSRIRRAIAARGLALGEQLLTAEAASAAPPPA
jgi:Family of unknown function (DUF6492)